MAVEKLNHVLQDDGRNIVGNRYKVAVIGGGLAGLSAARRLRLHYPDVEDVIVLEANSNIGGRVRNVKGLAPWPIEAGAEFLHGSKSIIKSVVDEMGFTQTEYSYPDFYYLGKEDQLLTNTKAEVNRYVQETHDIFAGLTEEKITEPDMSIYDYMKHKHASLRSIELADCFYANDFGCSIHELGLNECIQEAKSWKYGKEYLLLDRPLSSVVELLAEGLKVRVNSPVYRVDYSSYGVKIFVNNDTQPILADYAILAVPLTVLQRQMIEFVPPLPDVKKGAINAIGMATALKVMLAFSHRFWPDDMFHVLCADSFLPEVWSTTYPSSPVSKQQTADPLGDHVLVGFVAGAAADAAAALPKSEIFRRALMQFDNMFKDFQATDISCSCSCPPQECFDDLIINESTSISHPQSTSPLLLTRSELFKDRDLESADSQRNHPASCYFTGGCIINWAEEPYIYGGYTHPSISAHGARATLAEGLDGKLFFAGEATHAGVNPCMQGAIETGLRAAEEIVKEDATGRRTSKL